MTELAPISFSPWDMFLNAGPVVRCVMILLAMASLLTWTIFIAKSVELLRVRVKLTKAEKALEEANTLDLGKSGRAARPPSLTHWSWPPRQNANALRISPMIARA